MPETGARRVHEHTIEAALGERKRPGFSGMNDVHVGWVGAAHRVGENRHTARPDIGRDDDTAERLCRQGEGLPAGGRAHVEHPMPRAGNHELRDDLRRFVLHEAQALAERRRVERTPADDGQPVGRHPRRRGLDGVRGEADREIGAIDSEPVGGERQRWLLIIEGEPGFRAGRAVAADPAFHQPLRMRMHDGEIRHQGARVARRVVLARPLRPQRSGSGIGEAAQHRIGEAGGAAEAATS